MSSWKEFGSGLKMLDDSDYEIMKICLISTNYIII